ncbi:MAG: GC-type dockerin domain-anchored protein [Phycisphaerales bacterium]
MSTSRTLLAAVALAGSAHAQSFTDSFDSGVNVGGWTFDAPVQAIVSPGGCPAQPPSPAFLQGSALVTDIPRLRTGDGVASPFVGNYAARRVFSVWVAFKVFQVDSPTPVLLPSALLISRNGTPADPSDDWGAYSTWTITTGVIGTWGAYSYHVPSGSTAAPTYWTYTRLGPNAPAALDWPALMASVDALAFTVVDFAGTQPQRSWTVGADAVSIVSFTGTGACYANCDGGTTVPFLNVNDFICFLNRFAAGEMLANCDQSWNPPVLNVNDFICFNESFAAGCSGP